MIHEHDRVMLTRDVPHLGLKVGDVGTVVYVHKNNVAYEVEFISESGNTIGIEELEAAHVRPVGKENRVWNLRELVAAH